MARSYLPIDLVSLPPLSAAETLALAAQLLTTADSSRAVRSLGEPLEELRTASDELRAQLITRRALAVSQDPARAREADRQIDGAWSATRDWLSGWRKLGAASPSAEGIAKLDDAVFGAGGLGFITLKFEKQWAEGESRLSILSSRESQSLIRELGGALFVEHLRRCQKEYGDALGMTTAMTAPVDTNVMTEREAALSAIRAYVVAVSATVRPGNARSRERAEALLLPLTSWEATKGASPAGGGEPGGGPTPTS